MILLKGGLVLEGENELKQKDVLIDDGKIVAVEPEIEAKDAVVYLVPSCWIIPGAVDVHAHLREPGFEEKETILSGTMSAAKGGITTVMAMANLNPVPDCLENLKVEQDLIDRDAVVRVYPFASVTKGQKGEEIVDFCSLSKHVKGFSDDGVGFNNQALHEKAVKEAKRFGAIISSHAEAEGYGTTINAEVDAVSRELDTLRKIGGGRYHFCHLSTIGSFELVKKAQDEGLDVTCEVTPHHLTFCETYIMRNPNFKMNPPLRPRQHLDATVEALRTGIATIIATDHAPHTAEEKQQPFELVPNGVVGFESMLAVVYTQLVKTGLASHKDMLDWCVFNPAKRFELGYSEIKAGSVADIAVLDIETERILEEKNLVTKGKNSPFTGRKVYGMNRLTLVSGKIVYNNLDGGSKLWRKQ